MRVNRGCIPDLMALLLLMLALLHLVADSYGQDKKTVILLEYSSRNIEYKNALN